MPTHLVRFPPASLWQAAVLPELGAAAVCRSRRCSLPAGNANDLASWLPTCRSRLKGRVALTAAALALAVVYSLAIFNAGMQAAQHTEAQGALL